MMAFKMILIALNCFIWLSVLPKLKLQIMVRRGKCGDITTSLVS